MLCSCSTFKLGNTVWYSITPSELGDEKANVIDGMYFTENNKVLMKSGVARDTTLLTKTIYSGFGTYTCSGNSLKKGIRIDIKTDITTVGRKTNYTGLVTNDGMVLVAPDSTIRIYHIFNQKVK